MNFEHRLAYQIGVRKAHEDFLTKEAFILPALRTAGSTAKWLIGFGKGGTVSRTLGGATGYGLMGAATAEEGLENRLKGFAGGFASGLVFSGTGALASRAGRRLNRTYAAGAKGLNKETYQLAKTMDAQKAVLANRNAQASFKGTKNVSDQTKKVTEDLQASLKANQKAYKELLKQQNVGIGTRFNEAVMRNAGTVGGVAAGFGGGMYLSGVASDQFDRLQRPPIYAQNNQFNPVS